MTPSSSTTSIPSTRQMMHAMVYDDYGSADVLHLSELPVPPRHPGQLLLRVKASSVNPIDYRLRSGEMKGLLPFGFPRVPGFDVAGVVVDCTIDDPFSPGDRVIAFLDSTRGGACADFAVCAVDVAAKIPDSIPLNEAAVIPLAGTTALQSLRDHGKITPGNRVLINGASGGVGMFAVQIAKSYQCHVTAVASGEHEGFCRKLGADVFYDYEKVDFSESSESWDLIFDAAGKSSYLDVRGVLQEGGRYVSTEPDVRGMLMTVLTWPLSKSGTVMLARPSGDDLQILLNLHEQGKLQITIDSQFTFAELAQAHRRVESGVDRGKVVLINTLQDDGPR